MKKCKGAMKKKAIVSGCIAIATLVIGCICSEIFDFALVNTWQAGVIIIIVYACFFWLSWQFSTYIKKVNHNLAWLCYCLRFMVIIGTFSAIIVLLVAWLEKW